MLVPMPLRAHLCLSVPVSLTHTSIRKCPFLGETWNSPHPNYKLRPMLCLVPGGRAKAVLAGSSQVGRLPSCRLQGSGAHPCPGKLGSESQETANSNRTDLIPAQRGWLAPRMKSVVVGIRFLRVQSLDTGFLYLRGALEPQLSLYLLLINK